jgi:hypothetical protein
MFLTPRPSLLPFLQRRGTRIQIRQFRGNARPVRVLDVFTASLQVVRTCGPNRARVPAIGYAHEGFNCAGYTGCFGQ